MSPAARHVIAVCGLHFEAAIARGPGVQTFCATGSAVALLPELARAAAGGAGIISFGCAAGLDPALAPGDCLLADQVLWPGGSLVPDKRWLRALRERLPAAHGGVLACVDDPVTSREDKSRLWSTSGARAADMESHHVARIAARHGLPFVALRVVVDPSTRNLPPCAIAAMKEDGGIAAGPFLRSLAAHPGQAGAVFTLATDARAARRGLLRARALAGADFAYLP